MALVLVARFFGWSLDRRLESPSRELRSPPSLAGLIMRQFRLEGNYPSTWSFVTSAQVRLSENFSKVF